ncbi:MHS family MFS transporter [Leucobacter allii]|uniref:MFS transporter n=1 Tax=Leucobacter allii TaxID=2932247 RepID=UPI001FD5712D|nr:MFS transporter [Leucobacter allii]UOR01105.1 MHS family MFS transporter [Leucobacter allii]
MSAEPHVSRSTEVKTAVATFVGTAIEWYDFFIFGTAAALAFGPVFFPEATPAVGLLASFATFWVGFIARPIGGLIFGHLGDTLGRRGTLVATLLIMGVATTAIGLLPGYATIGIWAPILLVVLRAVQGLGLGGEWGGAVTMATENAPEKRRGLAGSWVQQGSPMGSILATLVFLSVGALPDEQFLSWGWRIPFLASSLLVLVALIARVTVEETPSFTRMRAERTVAKAPIAEAFRIAPVAILLGMGASAIGIAAAYFNNTFSLAWATTELGVDRTTMLNILLIIAVVQFVVQPLAALIAHRIGMARFMSIMLCAGLLTTIPTYLLIATGEPVLITAGLALSTISGAAYFALLAGFLADAFPPRVRYSGLSIAYQLSATIVGGATPLVAQSLLNAFGGAVWGVAGYHLVLLAITLLCVVALARHVRRGREQGSGPSGAVLPDPAPTAARAGSERPDA